MTLYQQIMELFARLIRNESHTHKQAELAALSEMVRELNSIHEQEMLHLAATLDEMEANA